MSNNAVLNVIFIGNPGVGKSTFLNSLMGECRFKSGFSLGKGLTTICQTENDNKGNKYIDTPGLSDISMRKQAAQEIKKALQSGGIFKIFFVITLESGRIRPDDKTTMKLVLEAAPINNTYAIIINKVEHEILEAFENKEEAERFFALLNEGLPGTTHVHLHSFNQSLSAKKNVLSDLSPDFFNFVFNAPMLEIKPNDVKDIKDGNFDKVSEELSKAIQELMVDNRKMRETIEKNMAAMEEMNRQHKKEMDKIRKSNERKINELIESHKSSLLDSQKKAKEIEVTNKEISDLRNDITNMQKEANNKPPQVIYTEAPKQESGILGVANNIFRAIGGLVRL